MYPAHMVTGQQTSFSTTFQKVPLSRAGGNTAPLAWLGWEHHRGQLNHPKCQHTARNPHTSCCRSSASETIWRVIYWACARAPWDQSTRTEKKRKGSVLWSQTDLYETPSLRFGIVSILLWITVKWEPQITSGKLGNPGDPNTDMCSPCLVLRVYCFPLAGAPGSNGFLQSSQEQKWFSN